MKAEDTINEVGCHCTFYHRECRCNCDDCISARNINQRLSKQAEISFKAGISEAIEFTNSYWGGKHIWNSPEAKAKLKEWGIKEA